MVYKAKCVIAFSAVAKPVQFCETIAHISNTEHIVTKEEEKLDGNKKYKPSMTASGEGEGEKLDELDGDGDMIFCVVEHQYKR